MLLLIQSVITCWRSFIQMVIIQMAHIVNNHIIMAFYIDCIHTDICEQSVITRWLSAIQMAIIQIQAHSPQNTQTYMKNVEEKKKKRIICAKSRSLSYAPIRWPVCHSVRNAPSRGSARIQINNLPCIFDFNFFGWFHSVWDITCYKIMQIFYHQDAAFERNLFHNGHKQ